MVLGQRDHAETPDTCIAKGSHITGTLKFSGTVRIEGRVEGEISAQETVVVGDTAVVEAELTADTIIITGKVTGDVTAHRRLEIRAPGQVQGNITTPSLVIHDGVRFEGQCSMGRAAENARADTPAVNGKTTLPEARP
jgi:cytoskeletal protein CcmA (bactofilin family)